MSEGKTPFGAFPSGSLSSWLAKLVILGIIDVLGIWAIATSFAAEWWLAIIFLTVVLLLLNITYFRKGGLPWKYLLPGLIFLFAFQLYPALYTFGASFTNLGTGHLISEDEAVVAIEGQSEKSAGKGQSFDVLPIEQDGSVSMLIEDPKSGDVFIGTAEGVEPTTDVEIVDTPTGGKTADVPGYEVLNLGALTSDPDLDSQWRALAVPWKPDKGFVLRASSPTRAELKSADVVYDPEANTFTEVSTGKVFSANGDVGLFTTDQFDPELGETRANDGEFLTPGWPVFVGFENYVTVVNDDGVRQNFIPILLWSFVFALGTVALQFGVGLLLALSMQHPKMRGQKIYRVILVLPYVIPIFMSALVWKGMLNKDFGIINQIIGQDIDWLGDGTLAKLSLLLVNLWIGYAYMYIVVTGALTSIPSDLKEAAFVDGASGFKAFRTITLPLLMVSVSPLLIASFSFNFNNFTLVELLTGGGPFAGSPIDGGQTDLLITYTYRLAFGTSEQLLGFASAISMLIFIIVAAVAAYGFRLTKRLEEIKQ